MASFQINMYLVKMRHWIDDMLFIFLCKVYIISIIKAFIIIIFC